MEPFDRHEENEKRGSERGRTRYNEKESCRSALLPPMVYAVNYGMVNNIVHIDVLSGSG